ncbi:unnamed protein product [Boreogadus saida]
MCVCVPAGQICRHLELQRSQRAFLPRLHSVWECLYHVDLLSSSMFIKVTRTRFPLTATVKNVAASYEGWISKEGLNRWNQDVQAAFLAVQPRASLGAQRLGGPGSP